ncbi:MAG: hypothetical protein AB7O66_18105, partial [Limisphaerales bacterium]
MNHRTRSPLQLAALSALLAVAPALAGVPEPDTVLFGSIALDGRYITAADTSVSVELRATANGPALRTYRMGSSPRAGNLFVLRASLETAPPLLQPDSLPVGATVHVVVREANSVRDSKSLVLAERGGFVRLDFGDVDGDGDGMSDAFEATYFGEATAGNPGLDPDNDGRPNLREFLDKTNPLVPDGRHPADRTPTDDAINIAEVTAYTLAWQLGEEWPVEPKVIPVDYVTRAGALWKGGEAYVFDNDPPTTAPLWWVNAPPPSPSLQDNSGDEAGNAPTEGAVTPGTVARKSVGLASRNVDSPTSAGVRSGPVQFQPAQTTPIRIRISPAPQTRSYAVEETPPSGWIIRNVSHGGRIDRIHNKIKWGPFYDTDPRDLSYELTPLPGDSSSAVFSGLGSFDGSSLTLAGIQQILPPGAAVPPPPAPVTN